MCVASGDPNLGMRPPAGVQIYKSFLTINCNATASAGPILVILFNNHLVCDSQRGPILENNNRLVCDSQRGSKLKKSSINKQLVCDSQRVSTIRKITINWYAPASGDPNLEMFFNNQLVCDSQQGPFFEIFFNNQLVCHSHRESKFRKNQSTGIRQPPPPKCGRAEGGGRRVDGLAGWLVGWLAGWRAGGLAGWRVCVCVCVCVCVG